MVCPFCSSPTRVNNSRLQKRLNQVWRRRVCVACNTIFTTHECVELETSLVVRYSPTSLLPFRRDTLLLSIYESCKHLPTAAHDASVLTDTVIALLVKRSAEGEIRRESIALVISQVLGRFDQAAATIYAAYHPTKAS